MPFASKAQQRWGNSPAGIKALGGAGAVSEWNNSTPSNLPDKVGKLHLARVKKNGK